MVNDRFPYILKNPHSSFLSYNYEKNNHLFICRSASGVPGIL